MIKSILGIAPTKENNGSGYIPSPLGRKFGVDKVSGYKASTFGGKKYTGNKKSIGALYGRTLLQNDQWKKLLYRQ